VRWRVSQVSGSEYKSAHTRQLRAYAPIFLKDAGSGRINGGEDEIRTHETCYSLPAFQASAFNHSATSPQIVPFSGDCGGGMPRGERIARFPQITYLWLEDTGKQITLNVLPHQG
jgi:hypothetical protein